MDSAREKRLADLLLAALEHPTDEQKDFLEGVCGGDQELLTEALQCLARENQLEGFLEVPAGEAVKEATPDHTNVSVLEILETTVAEPGVSVEDPESAVTESIEVHEVEASPFSPFDSPEKLWRRLGKRQLGSYPIIGNVGAGGMGQVFIGEDSRLRRRIAVKVLPPEMAERPGWLHRFEREARALAALNHPNIVTIHSIEEDAGIRFLTMELIEGATLKGKITKGGLHLEEFLRIAIDLTSALAAAHQQGVIHRDLKPANIMLTREGRVKILDFGIAKISQPEEHSVSQEGLQIGTVPYMAPEQLLGQSVDARSDLFSLGVVFYQMATGKHPFPGQGMAERISSVLKNSPPAASELRSDLPPALENVITRCLQTDPDDRYQSATELMSDLTELQENLLTEKLLESRAIALPVAARPLWQRWLAAGALLIAIAALAFLLPVSGPGTVPLVEASEIEPTPIAVLFFQNLAANPEVAWLETGITELLIADLSQSPGLDVTGTGQVHRLLARAEDQGWAAPPPEMLQTFVAKEDVEAVLQGSYAQLGDVLRIVYTLEEPGTGEILRTESLEGRGEDALFDLVDQLSASVLETFEAPKPELGPDTAQEATTGSLEAWRAFSQAQVLYIERSQPTAAIELLEDAIAIDPEFALAHVKLAQIHQSLGHNSEAEAYAQKAFDLADQLPLNTRFDVEGAFFGTAWTTTGRAIETYDLALKVYPNSRGWRNNLARRYAFFERYSDAIEEFEELIDVGEEYWGNYYGVANAYAALGDFETGFQVLQEAIARHPEHGLLQYSLAWHLTEWGRLDDAADEFKRVEELRPRSPHTHYGLWRLAVLQDAWATADFEAEALLRFDDSFAQWRGQVSMARNALYQGRSEEAVNRLQAAILGASGADRALARCFKAELHLTRGQPRPALEEAKAAQEDGVGHWPELRGYFLAALAEESLGRPTEADRLRELLREKWRRQPNAVEERQLQHLTGLLELGRGNQENGLTALERAAALLPNRGIEFSWHVFPDHLPIWTDLGAAELAAGRPQAALSWLSKAVASGSEHLEQPSSYIRAIYLKGLAHQEIEETDEALAALKSFLSHWENGDFYLEDVLNARAIVDAAGIDEKKRKSSY